MGLKSDTPIAVICEVLNYPRSQVYYQAQVVTEESDLKAETHHEQSTWV